MQTRTQSWIASALSLALFLVLTGASSHGAALLPPPNDFCEGAEIIPPAGPFPHLSSVIPRIITATTNGDPPLPPVFLAECATNVQQSVWYCFTPAVSGLYTFSTALDTATTVPDTVMGLFTATGPCGALTLYSCNDDSGTVRASISTNLTAGVLHYILVWVGEAHQGQVLTPDQSTVQLRVSTPLVPPSDVCELAVVVPPPGAFPSFSAPAPVDITLASDLNDPVPACTGYRGVWFSFTPTVSASYILSTGPETQTTVSDTSMAVYTGPCGGMQALQICIEGLSASLRAAVVRTLAAGTTYYIVVWEQLTESYIPGETLVQLRVSRTGPPVIQSTSALGIASTGAVLRTMVSPTAQLTRSWLEWGLTTAYTATTTVNTYLAATGAVTNSAAVSGLTPDVTYHFRAVATNNSGRVNGPDTTFRYSTVRPVLTEPVRIPGSFFRFEFSGNPGQLYLTRNTTDAGSTNDWADLDVAFELTPGLFEFIHGRPGNAVDRYYQLRGP